MQNPFLIIRYVCFSVILFLNLLALIFAAWNVAVSKSEGRAAPGASVLVLFNGSALFISIVIALVELVVVRVKTTKVKFECVWTAIMAVLQLAAALTITTTGPPVLCRPPAGLAACTSATALVPVAWLSTFSIVVYFLTLTITTLVYAPSYPGIWSSSIYDVPWFISQDPPSLAHKKSSSTTTSNTAYSTKRSNNIWDEDEEQAVAAPSRSCLSLVVAPWARPFQNKRGVDRPFATRSQVVAANVMAPVPPPKSHPPPIAARYMGLQHPFPSEVDDEDKPIPYATLSQWVRADVTQGRTVHTRPPITPR